MTFSLASSAARTARPEVASLNVRATVLFDPTILAEVRRSRIFARRKVLRSYTARMVAARNRATLHVTRTMPWSFIWSGRSRYQRISVPHPRTSITHDLCHGQQIRVDGQMRPLHGLQIDGEMHFVLFHVKLNGATVFGEPRTFSDQQCARPLQSV